MCSLVIYHVQGWWHPQNKVCTCKNRHLFFINAEFCYSDVEKMTWSVQEQDQLMIKYIFFSPLMFTGVPYKLLIYAQVS